MTKYDQFDPMLENAFFHIRGVGAYYSCFYCNRPMRECGEYRQILPPKDWRIRNNHYVCRECDKADEELEAQMYEKVVIGYRDYWFMLALFNSEYMDKVREQLLGIEIPEEK